MSADSAVSAGAVGQLSDPGEGVGGVGGGRWEASAGDSWLGLGGRTARGSGADEDCAMKRESNKMI